jgi:hypothetical protein
MRKGTRGPNSWSQAKRPTCDSMMDQNVRLTRWYQCPMLYGRLFTGNVRGELEHSANRTFAYNPVMDWLRRFSPVATYPL